MFRNLGPRLATLAGALSLLLAVACGGDGGDGPTPTVEPTPAPTAVDENVVVVTVTAGCDRPQPERGTELLALVRVTRQDGTPVIGAQVDGVAVGPGVINDTATDATYLDGEALLLFPVNQPGSYTVRVERVTLTTGEAAAFDPSSTLETTYDIGEVCTPP
jgi:hypothetical protein